MNIDNLVIYKKTLPPKPAKYAEFPNALNGELIECLKKSGISKLYSHQAEMFDIAAQGKNAVITTSTASGKTLSFLLPIINELLKNPLKRAILIYPTKALAADQHRAISAFQNYFGQDKICVGIYDGDTPPIERARIRKKANIILTNPDMLNGSFLPNHSKFGFDFIFSNLAFIVVDELHTYRGVFGSHVANVFRRLKRICGYYNSSPQFLCSSATIANPLELAKKVCGVDFEIVSSSGAAVSEKNYYLVQPPVMAHDYKLPASEVAEKLIIGLVEKNRHFLAFVKSRKTVEVILKESKDILSADSPFGKSLAERIAGYRSGYTAIERKRIEQNMIFGSLNGLVSTNALELGIDIGNLDSTVLVGFPGTRASFWQQTGRAGRSGGSCDNYLILDEYPNDQYLAINPDWLFDSQSENAVVDENNLYIQLAHIRAAAAELPITINDAARFRRISEILPMLIKVGEVKAESGRYFWCGSAYPAGDYSLRNMDEVRYKLINQNSNTVITETDEHLAFHELYEGAVYMHSGELYEVVKLDMVSKTAYAIPFNGNYYTEVDSAKFIKILKEQNDFSLGNSRACFGDINVDENIFGFKKLAFHNKQNMGYNQLPETLSKDYDTESFWLEIPMNVVQTLNSLRPPKYSSYFDGMGYAVKYAASMATMAEPHDIGVSPQIDVSSQGKNIFFYDRYVGGLGYSGRAFDLIEKVINNAIASVENCKCKNGCVACIGDYYLDKRWVLWGLKSLLEITKKPVSVENGKEFSERVRLKYDFKLEELPEKWREFAEYLKRKGESNTEFLSVVDSVEINGECLTLYVEDDFISSWLNSKDNLRSVKSSICSYVSPGNFEIEVKSGGRQFEDISDKLERSYRRLTEN